VTARLATVALLVLAGCKSQTRTMIVVEVDSDLRVPAELNRIEVDVRVEGKQQPLPSFPLVGQHTLPLRVGLTAAEELHGPMEIRATAFLDGTSVVSQEATVPFLEGQTRLLRLFLARACLPIPCAAGWTCVRGSCQMRQKSASELEPFDPRAPRGGADGQAAPDSTILGPDGANAPDERWADGRDALGAAMDGVSDVPAVTIDGAPDAPLLDSATAADAPPIAFDAAAPSDLPAQKLDDGKSCGASGQCASGRCIDGVCCNSPCNALCEACNLPGSVGTCTNVPSGQDPAAECGGPICMMGSEYQRGCDGMRACRTTLLRTCAPYVCGATNCKSSCADHPDCAGGTCRGGACCAGCWLNDICLSGNSDVNACGTAGATCARCPYSCSLEGPNGARCAMGGGTAGYQEPFCQNGACITGPLKSCPQGCVVPNACSYDSGCAP
jgi:hypothetical protein